MSTTLPLEPHAPSERDNRPRVGIIGTGIAGLTAASLLHERYRITVFEANDYIGGHAHTVDVKQDGQTYAVDTGFIVYNEKTYPEFIKLLNKYNVPTQTTSMSFSVRDDLHGVEYASSTLDTIFAQRSNLYSPRFLTCLREIVRFQKEALRFLDSGDDTTTMAEFTRQFGFSEWFHRWYLTPMLAAIWSASPSMVGQFPARHFLRFFQNHDLVTLSERAPWRTITGGSREYVKRLTAPFAHRIQLETGVQRIVRLQDAITVITDTGDAYAFDYLVIAAHSNEALRILGTPTRHEREVLSAIPYQPNRVVLHTDVSSLPRRRRAWASWNYNVPHTPSSLPTLTYNMNILQGIESRKPFLVTLNDDGNIPESEMLGSWIYSHPWYSRDAIEAQGRHAQISGADRIYYCGAYWGYGFHEDGVRSAIAVAKQLGVAVPA